MQPELIDAAARQAAIETLERYAAAGAIAYQAVPAFGGQAASRQWFVDRGPGVKAWLIATMIGERFAWEKGGYDTLRQAVQAYNQTNRQAAAL